METKGYYQGVANRLRIDMDSRSPRLRLSVLGLLLDGGLTPNKLGGTEEFLDFLHDLIEYLGAGLDSFSEDVERFEVPEDESDSEANVPVKDAHEMLHSDGYM